MRAALRIYVQGFSERSKIAARLDVPKDLPRLARDLEISIFRIVQACLTNIHKHAEAKSVDISITHSAGGITLQVADDGKGLKTVTLPGWDCGEWKSGFGSFTAGSIFQYNAQFPRNDGQRFDAGNASTSDAIAIATE